jgi:DNA polymerase-2
MKQFSGFLLDVYEHSREGVIVWLLCDDGIRRCFAQDFDTIFYIRSDHLPYLRAPWIFLRSQQGVYLDEAKREDLYDGMQSVMEVKTKLWKLHKQVTQDVQRTFPNFTYYDIDTSLQLRYSAKYNVFPLARCKVNVENNKITNIQALDSPWDIDPVRPKLRKLKIYPNTDPFHAEPAYLTIKYEKFEYKVPLNKPRDLLSLLNAVLRTYDPDVILTRYGDTWLFPYLAQISRELGIRFQPNRDLSRDVILKKGQSFFNYGKAHLRGPQVHLLGRWHIDIRNCMNYGKIGFEGTLEMSRITSLPVQEAARRSAGAGFSAMQVLTAMRRGVMIPYQHQKGEISKTYNQLFLADSGGLIAEPELGIFDNVAIIDFIMMYPSIMVHFNLSPETVGVDDADAWEIPGLGVKIARRRGLIPETLQPMVEKRIALKKTLKTMDETSPRWRRYNAITDAMKDLGTVSNGRMGFANSIFGRINAFEAISYIGRKIIIQAKLIAEKHGFTALHKYVDSLFIRKDSTTTEAEFKAVLDEIEDVTKLPIDLEAVYSWIAFVASTQDPDVPVSNRFFCRKSNGEFKVRGLAQRRGDTCPLVKDVQTQILEVLGQESDPKRLAYLLPEVVEVVRQSVAELKARTIPVEQLIVTRILSRELKEYKVKSALRAAAGQLEDSGKAMSMGQIVRYIHTRGKPGAYAWDLPQLPNPDTISQTHYKELVVRATYELVQPIGVPETVLRGWILGDASYVTSEGFASVRDLRFDTELPLLANLNSLEKKLIQVI